MTKRFKERVMRERIVDTRKYRYLLLETPREWFISRCPIECLGTTAVYNSWEVVCRW